MPLPLQFDTVSHTATSHRSPLQPLSQVHVSGAVQFPCSHADVQIGWSHSPGGPYPETHLEQSPPVKPFWHVHVFGALHTPYLHCDSQIGVSHLPGGPYPETQTEQSFPANPLLHVHVPEPDVVPDPSQVPWLEQGVWLSALSENADENVVIVCSAVPMGQLSQFGP